MRTVAGLVGFLFFIVYGQINRRIGPRKTSAICMVLSGLAYMGLGVVNSLVGYAICLCVVTGSSMSGGYIAGGTIVAQWFPKQKGIVMGYTTIGHNLASAFYVPMISGLVSGLGLQIGLIIPSILVMVLGISGLFLMRDTPQERGIYPDNATEEQYNEEYFTEQIDNDGGWTTKTLLKTKEFWLAAITTGLYQLVTVGIMTQIVVRNVQLGFTEVKAISLMTVLACIGLQVHGDLE